MIPLDQIGFNWRSHKAALLWLWLLYRRPSEVRRALANLPSSTAVRYGALIVFHSITYSLLSVVAFSLVVMAYGQAITSEAISGGTILIALLVLGEIAVGVLCGLVVWAFDGVAGGISVGVAIGSSGGLAFGILVLVYAVIAPGKGANEGVGVFVAGIIVGSLLGLAAGGLSYNYGEDPPTAI